NKSVRINWSMVRSERPSKICRSLSPGTFTFFRASDVTGKLTHHRTLQRNERIPRRRGGGESEGFDAPDEASGPGLLGGERRAPDGEDLRALIDALETFLGFGNRFNRGDPEIFDERSVQ